MDKLTSPNPDKLKAWADEANVFADRARSRCNMIKAVGLISLFATVPYLVLNDPGGLSDRVVATTSLFYLAIEVPIFLRVAYFTNRRDQLREKIANVFATKEKNE